MNESKSFFFLILALAMLVGAIGVPLISDASDESKECSGGNVSYTCVVSGTVDEDDINQFIFSYSSRYHRIQTSKEVKNGNIFLDKTNASKGDKVTISVKADQGYLLNNLIVKNLKGEEIEVTSTQDAETYTFIMPNEKIIIEADFVEEEISDFKMNFVDVVDSDYFFDAVKWAIKKEITKGKDDAHFEPMHPTTRAEMVTFLWRASGCPEPENKICKFSDIIRGSYYEKAVIWAAENDIVKGISKDKFGVNDNVTRCQAVTILARMEGVEDNGNVDDDVGSYVDVKENDYFRNAIAWAKNNGITAGTSAITFSPYEDCLRGQIVTFLWRDFENQI